MRFEGQDEIEIDQDGDLILRYQESEVRHRRPVVFQREGASRRDVEAAFSLSGDGKVEFEIGVYDAKLSLIIDPILDFSTFLNTRRNNQVVAVDTDAARNVYIIGRELSTGNTNVSKLSPDGQTLHYMTFFGSSVVAGGMVVDDEGNAIICGQTGNSAPVVKAFQPAPAGARDAFLAKISPDGSDLLFATRLGGHRDDAASSVALDPDSNIVVGGSTQSRNFPTKNAIQRDHVSADGFRIEEGFVAKFSSDGQELLFSTFLGGTRNDAVVDLAVDPRGDIHLVGYTDSSEFPTRNPFMPSPELRPGMLTLWVSKIRSDGSGLIYSSYFPGPSVWSTRIVGDTARAFDVEADSEGFTYVMGTARVSSGLPIVRPIPGFFGEVFLTKISPNGSTIALSTRVPDSELGPADFAIDQVGNVFVAARPRAGPRVGIGKARPCGRCESLLLQHLNLKESRVEFQTLVGTIHSGHAIALDDEDNIYVAADLESDNFPVTQNAFRIDGPATAVMKIIPQDACDPKPGFVLLEYAPGGDLPLDQEIELSCNGGPFVYEVRDADWLVVSEAPDNPGKVITSVNKDALPEATSIGTIDIIDAADNSVRSIPVKLRVENPAFRVRPKQIELTALLGSTESTTEAFYLETERGVITSVRIESSAPQWLELSRGSNLGPQFVRASPRNLPAGVYDAVLTITPVELQADPIELAVRLRVVETKLEDPVTPLVFRYRKGSSDPPSQTIQIRIAGLEHPLRAEKPAAAQWLRVTPEISITPSDLEVEVRPAGLEPGVYEETIEITARNPRTSFRETVIEAKTIQVRLEIEEGEPEVPQLTAAGIVNAADYRPSNLSQGEVVVAFGTHFGPETLQTLKVTADGRVDSVLVETRVLVDGIPAPIIFVIKNQVAFQVPFEASQRPTVVIEFEGKRSNAIAPPSWSPLSASSPPTPADRETQPLSIRMARSTPAQIPPAAEQSYPSL